MALGAVVAAGLGAVLLVVSVRFVAGDVVVGPVEEVDELLLVDAVGGAAAVPAMLR